MNINKIEILDALPNQLDWGVKSIKADEVWHLTQGEGVKIATIDTGIDVSHVELEGKIKRKFDFINRSRDIEDEYGHGTMVGGLLVGENVGVAPNSELYVAKVLDGNGVGSIANIMDGITFAMNSNVDILCLSLGHPRDLSLILKQRIVDAYEKGIIIVSAVGNNYNKDALYPSRMDEVIAVGGLDKDLKISEFSNRDYDVLAPSVDIFSSFKDGKYARMTGTSFASPLVAGAIALIISYYKKQGKKLSQQEIKNIINGRIDLTKIIK